MSSNRFYVPSLNLREGAEVELPDSVGRQLSRVLRVGPGDAVILFDGSGPEWPAEITSVQKNSILARVGSAHDPGTEASIAVTVYQALIPPDRMEYAVQKSTELGAARLTPVSTERVQAKDRSVSARRLERWHRIAEEAAEQCGRTRVPEVTEPVTLTECFAEMAADAPLILMWEDERGKNLREAVRQSLHADPRRVAVLIGPVGGLSEAEADAARSAGAILAGAGPRILRAETAPVVALTALMYEAGELS